MPDCSRLLRRRMLSKIRAAFSPEGMLPIIVGLRNDGSTSARLMRFAGRALENVTKYHKFVRKGC
jgi:hypothetical protein